MEVWCDRPRQIDKDRGGIKVENIYELLEHLVGKTRSMGRQIESANLTTSSQINFYIPVVFPYVFAIGLAA